MDKDFLQIHHWFETLPDDLKSAAYLQAGELSDKYVEHGVEPATALRTAMVIYWAENHYGIGETISGRLSNDHTS